MDKVMDNKELNQFLKTCRKHGVTEVSFKGFYGKLAELPQRIDYQEIEETQDTPDFENLVSDYAGVI